MTHRSTKLRMLPLLALTVGLAVVASAQAQDYRAPATGGTSATLQINFGSTPHWSSVRGTRVQEIRQGERADYDVFRYGGRYYAYNNDRWYMSRRPRGQFMYIDDRSVPSELSRVPRDHWRNYPSAWSDRNDQSRRGGPGQRNARSRDGSNNGHRDR